LSHHQVGEQKQQLGLSCSGQNSRW